MIQANAAFKREPSLIPSERYRNATMQFCYPSDELELDTNRPTMSSDSDFEHISHNDSESENEGSNDRGGSSGSTARRLSHTDLSNLKPVRNRGIMAGLLYPTAGHHRGSSSLSIERNRSTYHSVHDSSCQDVDSVVVSTEPPPQTETAPQQHSLRGDRELLTVSSPSSSKNVPSWGKPSKKNSLEDYIPDIKELEFAKLNTSYSSLSTLMEPMEPRPGTRRQASMGGNDTEQPTRRQSRTLVAKQLSSRHSRRTDPASLSEESEIEQQDSVRFKDQPSTMEIAPQSNSITQGNMSKEEWKQLEEVLFLSEREANEAAKETDDMTPQMEESKTAARNLWDAVAPADVEYGLLDSLIDLCKNEQIKIQKWINIVLVQEGDVSQLIALSENISHAIEVGEEALKNAPLKPPPTSLLQELYSRRKLCTDSPEIEQ
jgi:hypothetical protein